MTAGNAILIVAIVTGLGLIGALFFVMFKIRQISREFFGTSSLIEGLKRQEALEDDTPKSVSGMTRVELPRIEKDFPEFHWPEWKQRCENQLKGYLEALEHRDLSYLGNVSLSLKDQVRLKRRWRRRRSGKNLMRSMSIRQRSPDMTKTRESAGSGSSPLWSICIH